MRNLPDYLRQERRRKNLVLNDVAEHIGSSAAHVSDMETCKRGITDKKLKLWGEFLELSPHYLCYLHGRFPDVGRELSESEIDLMVEFLKGPNMKSVLAKYSSELVEKNHFNRDIPESISSGNAKVSNVTEVMERDLYFPSSGVHQVSLDAASGISAPMHMLIQAKNPIRLTLGSAADSSLNDLSFISLQTSLPSAVYIETFTEPTSVSFNLYTGVSATKG